MKVRMGSLIGCRPSSGLLTAGDVVPPCGGSAKRREIAVCSFFFERCALTIVFLGITTIGVLYSAWCNEERCATKFSAIGKLYSEW